MKSRNLTDHRAKRLKMLPTKNPAVVALAAVDGAVDVGAVDGAETETLKRLKIWTPLRPPMIKV